MFNLADYEKEIRTGATLSKVDPEESLNRFIYNLRSISRSNAYNNINFTILLKIASR